MFLAVCSLSGETSALAVEKNFTLQQAVEFSRQNNGELKALREEKGIREGGKIKAGLYPNPVLEMEGVTGKLTGSPAENVISVGISQEFPIGGKRGKRLQAAENELEGFGRQIDNAERLLREEVKTAYYDLMLAQKRFELAEHSLELNNQLLTVASERFNAGDIPELEVDLARVEVARSEGRTIDLERELLPQKARLLTLMGLPLDEEAIFSRTQESKPFNGNLSEQKDLALAQRPDLKALEAEKAKGNAEMALAKAEWIPNITAGISFRRESSAIEVGGIEAKQSDNLIAAKLSIPLPLFDRNQGGIREAHAKKASAENRYLFARQAIEREVESAHARLLTADKSVSIYSKNILPQLEENLKLVQEAYRLGEVGILTVIEEQKKFFEVNDDYLLALNGRNVALIKLESAVAVDLTGGMQ